MAAKGNHRKSRKKIVIIILIVIILGAGAAYGVTSGLFSQLINGTTKEPIVSKTGTEYKENLTKKQEQVDTLLTTGDQESIQKAQKIADAQVAAAQESNNDGYIVDASIQKAGILIQTGQAQVALDSILFPLNQKYESNTQYKYDIYECMSWAYRVMGDETTADEYFNKIP
jgi:hypothetical protein